MPNWHALTASSNGLAAAITTPCAVSLGFDPETLQPENFPTAVVSFTAIWDTGATASVISQAVVDACGLQPTGMTLVHGVHGPDQAETYLVNIGLPNGVGFVNVPVTKGILGNVQVLIGMDIIRIGDFAITNKDGKTVMSFRTPSQECIDFVKEAQKLSLSGQFSHGGKKHKREKKHKTFGKNKQKK